MDGPGGGRILLTTFTNALAATPREHLALLPDDPELLDRVEVTTVNASAYRLVREAKGRIPVPIADADERAPEAVRGGFGRR